MGIDLPAPLVPAEVTMGGNEWFPLYHRRLQKSRWWRSASDLARSRNIDLWCSAFEETPAGSLPDDDLDLADAAGFGRDVASFQALKAEIMAPWLRCSDGRWYHPALSEVVMEAWERTGDRRRKERERQAAHRERIKAQSSAHQGASEAHEGATEKSPPLGVTRDTPTPSRVTDPQVTPEGALQTDRQTGQTTVASAAPSATVLKPDPWKADAEFLTVWDGATAQMRRRAKSMAKAWTEWVKVRKTTEPAKILAGLRAYLREDPDVQRTGGPGLHVWLRDRTFEQWSTVLDPTVRWTPDQWAAALAIWRESDRWGENLGPKPGEPGCRVPPHLLLKAATI